MKCANPQCDHGIGLVSYRRAFAKRRYCSKQCRDSYMIEGAQPAVPGAPFRGAHRAPENLRRTFFDWLGGLVIWASPQRSNFPC